MKNYDMDHFIRTDYEQAVKFHEALYWAIEATTGDEQRAFKELRFELGNKIRTWPKHGDYFIEVLCLLANKEWNEFSDAFHAQFEEADENELDRIAYKSDNLDNYDHNIALDYIVSELHKNYYTFSKLVQAEEGDETS